MNLWMAHGDARVVGCIGIPAGPEIGRGPVDPLEVNIEVNSESVQAFPILETERLRLRGPRATDAGRLLAITQDADVMRYYGMQPFRDAQDALAEIEALKGLFVHSRGVRWVITRKPDDEHIGDIGLHIHAPAHARAEIGFRLAKAFWRQGLMTELMPCVIAYGFRSMQLNRIEALVDPRNVACLRLLRRCRFTPEGILREYEYEHGAFVDLAMLSLLKREWGLHSEHRRTT